MNRSTKNRYLTHLTILILIFSGSLTYAQSLTTSGRVVNDKGEGVAGVQVLLKVKTKANIIAYTISSQSGLFMLKKELKGIKLDSLTIEFSCMGFAKQTSNVPHNGIELLVKLKTKSLKIREVVVNALEITQKRDTIAYRVASFSSVEDRTIADVLKKMPGIEVMESGEIQYQGKKLNKFYIEGSDMLGGRYGLATNNISHKDVQSVEIMENHQAVKALEDLAFSDATAMNIKLKEDAKTRWAGTAKAGGGLPDLWMGEFFAMRFKKKFQTLNTYKANNIGGKNNSFGVYFSNSDFSSMGGTSLNNYINVSPSTASGISSSRSNFNKSHNASSNNLVKLKNGYDLTAEVIGKYEHKESRYMATTTFYLPEGEVQVEDKTEAANSLEKKVSGNIRLKANEESFYLNNNFDFNYNEKSTDIGIAGTYANTQNAATKSYKVSNDFDMLKREGDNFFTFRSANEFSSMPQSLKVTQEDGSVAYQDIALSSFNSSNSYDYALSIGRFTVTAPLNLNYNYRQIENTLNNELFDNVFNSTTTHRIRVNTTPKFDYNTEDLKLSLGTNIYYQPLSIDNQWHHLYGINPSLRMNWITSARLQLNASASWRKGLPNESLFYDGYIMNNYRSLTSGYTDMTTGSSTNLSIGLEYKDVLKSLFASADIRYSSGREKRVMAQDFEDEYILNYYIPGEYNADVLSASGSISKSIDAIDGSISFMPSYRHSKSTILRNGITIPNISDSYSFRLMIDSKISKNLMLTYNTSFGYSEYKLDAETFISSIIRFSQRAKVSYSPIKRVQISYGIEHFCNQLKAGSFKNFYFSDISASYLIGSRWEVNCSVNNLFNEKQYSYFIESDLTSYFRNYVIRPRNILISTTYRF